MPPLLLCEIFRIYHHIITRFNGRLHLVGTQYGRFINAWVYQHLQQPGQILERPRCLVVWRSNLSMCAILS